MVNNVRVIEFTEDEKLKGWNHVDLGDFGDFYGDLIVPELREIYGWWYPTEYTLKETDDPEIKELDMKHAPYWVSLIYLPNEFKDEEELLQAEDVMASDFLSIAWCDWVIRLVY